MTEQTLQAMVSNAVVLQVISTTSRRGAEVFALDLERALRERGRRVQTVALAPGDGEHASLDIPTLGEQRLAPSTLRALRSRLHSVGVIVGHGSSSLPAGIISSIGMDVPFIYRSVGDPSFWANTKLRRMRVGILLRRARYVVALTHRAAEVIAERYHVSHDRLRVIPNGVPAERFPLVTAQARTDARLRLGLPEDRRLIAYVGALSAEKDPVNAVEAIARLPDVHLAIAGSGAERSVIEGLAASIAPGRVSFLGQVMKPTQVYAAADAVVLSSRTEGLPGVLIEAGFSGLPVAATDVGYVRDIVDDGVTGFVAPPNDPAALGDAVRAALEASPALGQKARARCAALFDIGRVADSWDSLLAESCGK